MTCWQNLQVRVQVKSIAFKSKFKSESLEPKSKSESKSSKKGLKSGLESKSGLEYYKSESKPLHASYLPDATFEATGDH